MKNQDRNSYIEKHLPFIIKTVSDFTGRYVEIENNEELSTALEAFNKSIDTYDKEQGNFFTYSKVIIRNSLVDNLRKKDKKDIIELDEKISERGRLEVEYIIKDELMKYEKFLAIYEIDYELLCDKAPKHKDTRQVILGIGKKVSTDEEVIEHLKNKKRLPLTLIAKKYEISIKRLKTYKEMIIAVIIAYVEKIGTVIEIIEEKEMERL